MIILVNLDRQVVIQSDNFETLSHERVDHCRSWEWYVKGYRYYNLKCNLDIQIRV